MDKDILAEFEKELKSGIKIGINMKENNDKVECGIIGDKEYSPQLVLTLLIISIANLMQIDPSDLLDACVSARKKDGIDLSDQSEHLIN